MAALASSGGKLYSHAARNRAPRVKAPLRIALFADNARQPRWIVEAFTRIARADFAEVVVIAVSPRVQPVMPWLWRLYRRVDKWLFGTGENPSESVDLRSAIPDARYLALPPPAVGAAPDWHEAVAPDRQLDVAFVLGELDDAEFENIAKYGIWRYCFGEDCGTREELAGWREVNRGSPVTASGLRVRLWPGTSRLICQSQSRTSPLSVYRNRSNLFSKMGLFVERELRMLSMLGGARLKRSVSLPALPTTPGERLPSNGEILRGWSRIGPRILRRSVEKLCCIDQWFIAYRFGAPNWDGNMDQFIRLLPPKDRIWADPFPLFRDGRYFIFFEEVIYASGKGHIAMVEISRDGTHTPPLKVLECGYHLSYPFLIKHAGDLFMVPESGQNRSVELYRCIHFPDQWRLEKVLLDDVACADATFHRSGERWWMFVNIGAEGSELYDELHLFYADDLLGTWQPHRCNPVKSDVSGARPAGRLFMHKGALHRPAQICAPLYGSGVTIAEVLQLSPLGYQEQEVARILPTEGQGILGIHTLNRSGNLNVVDGFTRRSRL